VCKPGLVCREIGLFGCDVGLFDRDIQAHLKIHNIHSYYHQTTRIYTFHTHERMYVYVNISVHQKIPRRMYLLAHVGLPTVVVGRGVDVIDALVVAALHVTS